MPESRDRLSRRRDDKDVLTTYINRRRRSSRNAERRSSSIINNNINNINPVIFVLEDEPEERRVTQTPIRWRGTPMVGTPGPIRGGGGGGGGLRVVPVATRFGSIRSPASPVFGSGRGSSRSVLPNWYPRTPLRDITAIARAIERRRSRLGEGVGLLQSGSPIPHDWRMIRDHSSPSPGAQLKHNVSMISPHPTVGVKCCSPSIGKVPKILLNIANQNDGDSACLTPQKKLLNNIDVVEKVVMKELQKLKRTPSAKRAEREKRVRTLMSMR